METKRVVFVATECEPFFSTGNLGSVVGSLTNRLAKHGKDEFEISVILPLYSHINRDYRNKLIYVSQMMVTLAWRKQYCGIYKYEKNGVTFYFLDNEYYFKRHKYIVSFLIPMRNNMHQLYSSTDRKLMG